MQRNSFRVFDKAGAELLVERQEAGIALHAIPGDGGSVVSVQLDEEAVESLREVLAKPEAAV